MTNNNKNMTLIDRAQDLGVTLNVNMMQRSKTLSDQLEAGVKSRAGQKLKMPEVSTCSFAFLYILFIYLLFCTFLFGIHVY